MALVFCRGPLLNQFHLGSVTLKEPVQNAAERAEHRRKFNFKFLGGVFKSPKILIPVLVFFLLTFAFVQLEITFGLFLLDKFKLTERDAGLMLAGMGVVMAFIQGGALGRLVKKYGEYNMIQFGLPLILFGLVGLIFSVNLVLLSISLAILACGYSFTNPCLRPYL